MITTGHLVIVVVIVVIVAQIVVEVIVILEFAVIAPVLIFILEELEHGTGGVALRASLGATVRRAFFDVSAVHAFPFTFQDFDVPDL
jgi:hypothetical protein